MDENEKKILKDIVKTGTVDDTYITEEKRIKNLRSLQEMPNWSHTPIRKIMKNEEYRKDEDKGFVSKYSDNTNGIAKEDYDSSKITTSNNRISKSIYEKTKKQLLPKVDEKTEGLGIMLRMISLTSISIFAILKSKKKMK